MSNGASIKVSITLDGLNTAVKGLEELGRQVKNTGDETKQMVKDLDGVQKSVQGISDTFGAVGTAFTKYVTAPIIAGTGFLLNEFTNLEYAIEKIDTLTSDLFDKSNYTTELLDMSRLIGVNAPDLSEIVYTGLTASVPEGEIMDFTMVAHMLATGGFTNEAKAVDVLTTAMNAYGYSTEDAKHLSDLLISTQDRGKTTVDDLATSLGDVIPIASDNNLPFEQLAASMALLTKNGIGTARASTYIRSMLNELGRSGSRSDEALRELSGKGFRQLMEEGHSLGDVLGMLSTHAEDNDLTLQDMFGNIRGGTGAMSLLTNDGADLAELIEFMGDVSGRTDDNFEKMSNTMQYKLKQAFNDIRTSGYEVALALTPLWETLAEVMGIVADKVRELADWFVGLDEETQTLIVTIGAVLAVIGPILLVFKVLFGWIATGIGVIGKLVKYFFLAENGVTGFGKTFRDIKTVFKGVWTLIKGFGGFLLKGIKLIGGLFKGVWIIIKGLFALILAHPFVAIGVAVVAIVTTIIVHWETLAPIFEKVWEKIKEVFFRVLDRLVDDFNTAKDWILGIWDSMAEGLGAGMEWLSETWSSIWGSISGFFIGIWEAMSSALSTAWEFIKAIIHVGLLWIVESIRFAGELFLAPWTFIWVNFGEYLTEAWEWISDIISTAVDWITGHLTTGFNFMKDEAIDIWETLKRELSAIWEWISNLAKQIWEPIATFFSETWRAIKILATDAWESISSFFSKIWGGIKDTSSKIWTEIKVLMSEAWNSIKSNVEAVLQAIWSVVTKVWEGIKGTTSRIWNTIKSFLSGLWGGLKGVASTSFNAIKDTATTAWNSISTTTSKVWNKIKDTITDVIGKAGKAVKSTIDKMKGYFSFEWNLPKLKLPRVTMKGKFSLTPPSVPSFGLDWYAKGGIATGPSVVGIGEAGDEAILPLSNKSKMKPFALAVSSMMKTDDGSSENTVAVASQPTVISVQIDGREIARATADHMDGELRGRRDSKNRARGGY